MVESGYVPAGPPQAIGTDVARVPGAATALFIELMKGVAGPFRIHYARARITTAAGGRLDVTPIARRTGSTEIVAILGLGVSVTTASVERVQSWGIEVPNGSGAFLTATTLSGGQAPLLKEPVAFPFLVDVGFQVLSVAATDEVNNMWMDFQRFKWKPRKVAE